MLYIQNGVTAPNMTNTGRSFKDFIQTYRPRNVSINNDNKGKLKASQQLAFSGRLVDDTHKIESVLERDLIALDLDFIHSSIKTKSDLFKLLKEPLGGLNWYLYPTISNGSSLNWFLTGIPKSWLTFQFEGSISDNMPLSSK